MTMMRDSRQAPAPLTDAAIKAMFTDRASRAQAADLRAPILAATSSRRQARGWRIRLSGLMPATPLARVLVLALVAVSLVGLALATSGERRDTPQPIPSPVATTAPTPIPSVAPTPTLAPGNDDGRFGLSIERGFTNLVAGRTYTSDLFVPRVSFQVLDRTLGSGVSDVCEVSTSSSTIVMQHPKACVEEIRLIHPASVDCGDGGAPVDATSLALAIKGQLGPSVKDLGTLTTPGAIPQTLFGAKYPGRVLIISEAGDSFDEKAVDPDGCRLLPAPGTKDAVIEIRRDTAAELVLIDVGDQLVVLRIGPSGYDAPSTADALSRGYNNGFSHLLTIVHDITFP
jgi:hypothetical protein